MELNIASAKEVLDANSIAGLIPDAQTALAHAKVGTQASTSNGPTSTTSHPAAAGYAERMQLINEEQKYNQDFTKYLVKWDLEDVGFGYNLCAVLGSQSTGKSTLLNKLFGTSFDVMDETQRRQTTKGIWMCRGNDCNVLVMDVEGTDGRERGEDQDFERKSALFSMASAEVLLVNMWEHQVGLYQGANMGLLKTVFEVNLGLFQASKRKSGGPKDKTLLLFIIRDHIGNTPLENLQATVLADLTRIWESLSKPEGLESSQITDFFDFAFTTLPHKVLQPAEFDSQVATLRHRFVDPKNSGFVFKTEYHKRIPADGLPHYLESIWDQVMSNKDLDLPTQQELLAQFRCDEIASAAFTDFGALIKPFRRPLEAGTVLETLGADMAAYRGAALATFDKAASRYHQEVYKRKRLELLEKLNSSLSPLFLGQLKNLHKRIVASFKAAVQEGVRGDGYDFGEVVSGEQLKARSAFEAAAALILLADTDWSVAEEKVQLDEELGAIADQCRIEETKKMLSAIERTIKKDVAEPTELALSKPTPDMWDKILSSFKESLERAEATYVRKARSFNSTEAEQTESLRLLRRRAWLALHAKIEEQTADAVLIPKLRAVFEDRFRYDDEGVPRVWRPEDDIDGAFRKARDETLALIPLYARIEPTDPSLAVTLPSTSDDPQEATEVSRGELDEFDFASTLVLFSETRRAAVGAALRRAADAYYVEAKRSTVSSVASIPYWMYAVLAALGWNEFLAVVRSPVYFTFLVLCAGAAYVVWRLNLSGPVAQVATAVGREVHRLADQQLRAHFSQPLPQPAILRERERPASLEKEADGASVATGISRGEKNVEEEYELKERKAL